MYHPESEKIYNKLQDDLDQLCGGTIFSIGDTSFSVVGRDGLGGLIEEWFGVWADKNGFNIHNPKLLGQSQEFPDYYVGSDNGFLEIKAFDYDKSANFDLANFQSYCESVANNPSRLDSDYLIFGYTLNAGELRIKKVWLKKIWQITCPSDRWPLRTQTKRNVIYNIRPASWDSSGSRYKPFCVKEEFIDALYETEETYTGASHKDIYLKNSGG